MNPEDAKKLLFEIANIVETVGLKYMLYGGTCLGAIRDKAFVATDKDVDFACLNEDFVPVAKILVKMFSSAGMTVELIDHRHERPWSGLPYGIKISKYGVNSDFFSHFKVGNRRFVPSHYGSYCLVHKAEYLENLREIEFYGRRFNIPDRYSEFLVEKYGNWREPHREFYNVSKETCRKDCKDGNDFWWI